MTTLASASAGSDAGFPDSFYCPITHEIMKDPVIDPTDGQSYERSALLEWVRAHGTSPATRRPISAADLENVQPNRTLRSLIEAAVAKRSESNPAATSASTSPSPSGTSVPNGEAKLNSDDPAIAATVERCDGGFKVTTTLKAAGKGKRCPLDICCVLDVSGSMQVDATVKNTDGETESHGLTVLDIVKHAVRTTISTLGPNDRLSLVAYNGSARVVHPMYAMTDALKRKSKDLLDGLTAGGQTNIWHGLMTGMETLSAGAGGSESKTSGGDVGRASSRVKAVLLFTDGVPNVIPTRGHIHTLQRYVEKNIGNRPDVIHTFGFGYKLDSELLDQLAIEGRGGFHFIPDSSFVGTIFVNALANLLSTGATGVQIDISSQGGQGGQIAAVHSDRPAQEQKEAGTTRFDIGCLRHGQSRTLCFRGADAAAVSVSIRGNIVQFAGTQVATATLTGESVDVAADSDPEVLRCQLVALLAGQSADDFQATAPASLRTLAMSFGSGAAAQTVFGAGLLKDMSGEIRLALQSSTAFKKWGRHYLRSLRCAHSQQYCNNFKDPGVQNYGGNLFEELRDETDDIFNTIPPPQPRPSPSATHGGSRSRSSSSSFQSTPNFSFTYNNAAGPCYAGECQVRMRGGGTKLVRDLRKDDWVATGAQDGPEFAAVRCVVRTSCPGGVADLVELRAYGSHGAGAESPLRITPWHPVRSSSSSGSSSVINDWDFPCNRGPVQPSSRCDAVYSVLLTPGATSMEVSGIACLSLAHGIEGHAVASHPFFGTQEVVENLRRMPGFAAGRVDLCGGSCVVRDEATGLVCGLV